MSSIDNDFFVFKFTQNGLRVYEKHELKIFLNKFYLCYFHPLGTNSSV